MKNQVTWKRGPGGSKVGECKLGTYTLKQVYVRGLDGYGGWFWVATYNGRKVKCGSGSLTLAKVKCDVHAEKMAKRD